MTRIHGLSYERVNRNGHRLILYRDPGLRPEDIVRVEKNMLQANAIPQLLPVEFGEVDQTLRLLYDYTGLRPLSQEIRFLPLDEDGFVRLLLKLSGAVKDSPSYMLSDHRYVWDPDFIFVGRDREEVRLMYLPLHLMNDEEDLSVRWGNLVKFLWSGVARRTGRLDSLTESILTLNMPPEACRDILIESIKKPVAAVMQPEENLQVARMTVQSASTDRWKISFHMPDSDVDAHNRPLFRNPDAESQAACVTEMPGDRIPKKERFMSDLIPNLQSDRNVSSRPFTVSGLFQRATRASRAGIAAGCALLVALWASYAGTPSDELLYFCTGLTLLAVVLLCLVLKYKTEGHSVENGIPNAWLAGDGEADPASDNVETDAADYYDRLPGRTTLLGKPGATVLLSAKPEPANESQNFQDEELQDVLPKQRGLRARLETTHAGVEERLPLEGCAFLIGRDSDSVDYRIAQMEVSRHHAEFLPTDTGYTVRDLGSKNGTRLNEEPMIPYKEYLVEDGDGIEIANIPFVYRTNA